MDDVGQSSRRWLHPDVEDLRKSFSGWVGCGGVVDRPWNESNPIYSFGLGSGITQPAHCGFFEVVVRETRVRFRVKSRIGRSSVPTGDDEPNPSAIAWHSRQRFCKLGPKNNRPIFWL